MGVTPETKMGGRSVRRVVEAAYVVVAARGSEMEDAALNGLEKALRDLHSIVQERKP